jgi:hypothetical protein
MAKNKQIQNVAIVGTGVIGASWAALYLAHGFNVTATDPAPNAEANLRKFIDAAWKDLSVIGLSPNASHDHLQFTPDMIPTSFRRTAPNGRTSRSSYSRIWTMRPRQIQSSHRVHPG